MSSYSFDHSRPLLLSDLLNTSSDARDEDEDDHSGVNSSDQALFNLLARYNDLIVRFQLLKAEKESIEKSTKRVMDENSSLWKSLKSNSTAAAASAGAGSTGSRSPRPSISNTHQPPPSSSSSNQHNHGNRSIPSQYEAIKLGRSESTSSFSSGFSSIHEAPLNSTPFHQHQHQHQHHQSNSYASHERESSSGHPNNMSSRKENSVSSNSSSPEMGYRSHQGSYTNSPRGMNANEFDHTQQPNYQSHHMGAPQFRTTATGNNNNSAFYSSNPREKLSSNLGGSSSQISKSHSSNGIVNHEPYQSSTLQKSKSFDVSNHQARPPTTASTIDDEPVPTSTFGARRRGATTQLDANDFGPSIKSKESSRESVNMRSSSPDRPATATLPISARDYQNQYRDRRRSRSDSGHPDMEIIRTPMTDSTISLHAPSQPRHTKIESTWSVETSDDVRSVYSQRSGMTPQPPTSPPRQQLQNTYRYDISPDRRRYDHSPEQPRDRRIPKMKNQRQDLSPVRSEAQPVPSAAHLYALTSSPSSPRRNKEDQDAVQSTQRTNLQAEQVARPHARESSDASTIHSSRGVTRSSEDPQSTPPTPSYGAPPSEKSSTPFVPEHLPHTRVRVPLSNLRTNNKGKEFVLFTIEVHILQPPPGGNPIAPLPPMPLWRIEKTHNDVLQLDSKIRSASSRSELKGVSSVPDQKLFKDHAPQKNEQRRLGLEQYLQTLSQAPLKSKALSTLCAFLVSDHDYANSASGSEVGSIKSGKTGSSANGFGDGPMSGWLTKRGRHLGGWQTRYYVLNPGVALMYYDTKDSIKIGEIPLVNAAIGRQSSKPDSKGGDEMYLHAFLIRAKYEKEGEVDHILCAESDEARDAWVAAMTSTALPANRPQSSGKGSSSRPGSSKSNRDGPPSSSGGPPLPFPSKVQTSDHSSATSAPHSYESRSKPAAGSNASTNGMLSIEEFVQSGSIPTTPNSMHSTGFPITDRSPREQIFESRRHPSPNEPGSTSQLSPSESMPTHLSRSDTSSGDDRNEHESQRRAASAHDVRRPTALDKPSVLRRPNTGGSSRPGTGTSLNNNKDRPDSAQTIESVIVPDDARLLRHDDARKHDSVSSNGASSNGGHPNSSNAGKISTSDVSGPMKAAPLPSGYDFKAAKAEARSKKTKSSFWGGFGRNDKSMGSTLENGGMMPSLPGMPPRPVFGLPLKEAVSISRIRPGLELPAVVYRCVEYLEAKNAEVEEGIFRLSGSANDIRTLRERFNTEGDVNLLGIHDFVDPHAVAGLLKSYLRELPGHLLTRELHDEFVQVIDMPNRKDRVNALGSLVARLPIEEYTLFRFLFAHLCVIAQNAEVSKMTLRNLGIVFSPTLAIPAPLFSMFLSEFDLVFAVEPETGCSNPVTLGDDPADELQSPERPPPHRNSRLYSASGAPMLMEPEALRQPLRELDVGGGLFSPSSAPDWFSGDESPRDLSPVFPAPPQSAYQRPRTGDGGNNSNYLSFPPSPAQQYQQQQQQQYQLRDNPSPSSYQNNYQPSHSPKNWSPQIATSESFRSRSPAPGSGGLPASPRPY